MASPTMAAGLCMAMVQAGFEKGTIRVIAAAEGLQGDVLEIESEWLENKQETCENGACLFFVLEVNMQRSLDQKGLWIYNENSV